MSRKRGPGREWTQPEVGMLTMLRLQRVPVWKIAETLGRTIPSVTNQVERQNLVVRRNRLWSLDEDRRLGCLWIENVAIDRIAKELNRSQNAVKNRAADIGLPRRLLRQEWSITEVQMLTSDIDRVIVEFARRTKRKPTAVRSKVMLLLTTFASRHQTTLEVVA